MNTIFKRGNFYISPKLGDHVFMMVSLIKSNDEDYLYAMVSDGSYITIPFWQLGYYKELTPSQYVAMNDTVVSMRATLDRNNDSFPKKPSDCLPKNPAVEPSHYGGKDNTYEAIKVIEAWKLDFYLGNVAKYISRAGKKDKSKELEDLLKAQWYLNKKIELWQEEN
jgi:hypothetical protein